MVRAGGPIQDMLMSSGPLGIFCMGPPAPNTLGDNSAGSEYEDSSVRVVHVFHIRHTFLIYYVKQRFKHPATCKV